MRLYTCAQCGAKFDERSDEGFEEMGEAFCTAECADEWAAAVWADSGRFLEMGLPNRIELCYRLIDNANRAREYASRELGRIEGRANR